MGRDVDKPVETGSAYLNRAGAVPGPSGDPVRPDPILPVEELEDLLALDGTFADAEDLPW